MVCGFCFESSPDYKLFSGSTSHGSLFLPPVWPEQLLDSQTLVESQPLLYQSVSHSNKSPFYTYREIHPISFVTLENPNATHTHKFSFK